MPRLVVLAAATLLAAAPVLSVAAPGTAFAGGTKTCRYKLSTGKIKTWTCGKDQPCCASEAFNLFTCGSQLLKCL